MLKKTLMLEETLMLLWIWRAKWGSAKIPHTSRVESMAAGLEWLLTQGFGLFKGGAIMASR